MADGSYDSRARSCFFGLNVPVASISRADTQEKRTGVVGNAFDQMLTERGEIEVLADNGRNHPGAAFRAWNGYSVNDRFDHAGMRADCRGNLGG